jgi:tetratricopeptide (TPR) repeat protein
MQQAATAMNTSSDRPSQAPINSRISPKETALPIVLEPTRQSIPRQGSEINMKQNNNQWLELSEYLLLAGTGIGSVAAIASQQIAFSAAPMSALMLVNVVNRRRADQAVEERVISQLAQIEQRFSKQADVIDRRVQSLPTFWDLASLRKTILNKNRVGLSQLQQEHGRRLMQLEAEAQETGQIQTQVSSLKAQQNKLVESLEFITAHLHKTASTDRVRDIEVAVDRVQGGIDTLHGQIERISRTHNPNNLKTLQGQIDQLNRRLNVLPNPTDTTRLRQELDGLLKIMGDMVTRREMQRMLEEVEQIRNQQHELDATVAPMRVTSRIMRRQVEALLAVVRNNDQYSRASVSPSILQEIRQAVTSLESRISNSPSEADLVKLQGDLHGMLGSQIDGFKEQIDEMNRANQMLGQQQTLLQGWMNRLPEMLDFSGLRNQMKYLDDRIERSEANVHSLTEQVDGLNDRALREAQEFEMLFDLQHALGGHGGRHLLEEVLASATDRLVVVFPQPDCAPFDVTLIQQFRGFLDRGGHLDIGWGNLKASSNSDQPRYIQPKTQGPGPSDPRHSLLKKLLLQLNQLRQEYPDRFRFKVLGTDDNFLLCDRTFAVLGFQSLNLSSSYPRVAVGLRTTNDDVIAQLSDRFDTPQIAADDAEAYFTRAITRYALEEKEGAMADYTQVVEINPQHDLAYNNRALVRYELGNREGAIADLNRAIHANPSNAIAYCNRGVIRSELGNAMGAVEDFSYAIHVDASCSPAYFQRGIARTQMGNKMGAVEDFSDVIRLNDQEARAYYYRGMARTKLGDRITAIRDLKESARLFAIQNNQASHQQAITLIAQLQKLLVIDGSGDSVNAAARSS